LKIELQTIALKSVKILSFKDFSDFCSSRLVWTIENIENEYSNYIRNFINFFGKNNNENLISNLRRIMKSNRLFGGKRAFNFI